MHSVDILQSNRMKTSDQWEARTKITEPYLFGQTSPERKTIFPQSYIHQALRLEFTYILTFAHSFLKMRNFLKSTQRINGILSLVPMGL